jgi:hypothetical protein
MSIERFLLTSAACAYGIGVVLGWWMADRDHSRDPLSDAIVIAIPVSIPVTVLVMLLRIMGLDSGLRSFAAGLGSLSARVARLLSRSPSVPTARIIRRRADATPRYSRTLR